MFVCYSVIYIFCLGTYIVQFYYIRSEWVLLVRRTSISLVLTVVYLSEKMVHLKWVWRTWLCSEVYQVLLFSIQGNINFVFLELYSGNVKLKCYLIIFSDGVSCERAVEMAANTKGICYIRTSRPNTSMLYPNNETFKVIFSI